MASALPIFPWDLSKIIWSYIVDDVREAEEKGLDLKPYRLQACHHAIDVRLKMFADVIKPDKYTRCCSQCFDIVDMYILGVDTVDMYGWCPFCYNILVTYVGDKLHIKYDTRYWYLAIFDRECLRKRQYKRLVCMGH